MGELADKCARTCYENGNPVTGKKIYELHAFCDCVDCIARRACKKEPRNFATFTIKDNSEKTGISEFIKNWKCKDGTKHIKTEYFQF